MCVLAIVLLGAIGSASAATRVVTTASDSPSAGALTLREAVAESQPRDVITFAVAGPVYLQQGEIVIRHDLEVRGPADALVRIERRVIPDTRTGFRLFRIDSGQVRFSNVAFAHGAVRHLNAQPGVPGAEARGGAIFNDGELTVIGCLFLRNSVSGGWGSAGEVGSAGGAAEGGAIYNRGTLDVRNSLFNGNGAGGGGGGFSRMGGFPAGDGAGGALFNAGRAVIFNCTFVMNGATGGAGGSAHDPNPGGKGGTGRGGAVANTGEIALGNATIYMNRAQGGHGGFFSAPSGQAGEGGDAFGGGVFAGAGAESRTLLHNTLLGFNETQVGSLYTKPGVAGGSSVSGVIESRGHNLVSDQAGSSGWRPSDQLDADPMLRTYIHDNGGNTATFALRPGSPAIDAGGPTELSTDQRGLARTFDNPEVENVAGGDGTDIGAFELQPAAPAAVVNLSARGRVLAADQPLIGGIIISGESPKKVLFRGVGYFTYREYIPGTLEDPILEIYDSAGRLLAQNDNWEDSQGAEIHEVGLYTIRPVDAAVVITLPPGAYTAVVRGKNGGTGLALVEAYGLSPARESYLANLGVRTHVGREDDVLIGGFVLAAGRGGNTAVYIRSLGPSLADRGVVPLVDPTLALHDEDGNAIAFNDNWKDSQRGEIEATGVPPSNDLEAAMVAELPPGGYTAVVRGHNDAVGVSVLEIYNLDD